MSDARSAAFRIAKRAEPSGLRGFATLMQLCLWIIAQFFVFLQDIIYNFKRKAELQLRFTVYA